MLTVQCPYCEKDTGLSIRSDLTANGLFNKKYQSTIYMSCRFCHHVLETVSLGYEGDRYRPKASPFYNEYHSYELSRKGDCA